MELTFQEESIEVIFNEGYQLLKDHWKEVAYYQEKINLAPNYEEYRKLEDLGMLHVTTARSEGVLVGYEIHTLQKTLHYKDSLWAINDAIYIAPSYRKGTAGIKLLKESEKFLEDRGVDIIVMRVKTNHNFGKILKKMGYKNTELSFTKYVGE